MLAKDEPSRAEPNGRVAVGCRRLPVGASLCDSVGVSGLLCGLRSEAQKTNTDDSGRQFDRASRLASREPDDNSRPREIGLAACSFTFGASKSALDSDQSTKPLDDAHLVGADLSKFHILALDD